MKLEVGMYVRTKDGIIDKVIIDYNGHCANPNCEYKHISCAKNYYDEDTVTKSSYNIIDILKVGDYVNGYEVKDIDYAFDDIALNVKKPRIVPYIDNIKNAYIDNIKSVITHEQMEQMEYKVEE